MGETDTADAACIVRVWIEPGDPVLRGRISTVPGTVTIVARGVDDLVDAVRAELTRLESLLGEGR
ncbi:hypothetical protein [Actinoplanes subglobosus]|uniref:Uncharacterized protein n=1 Tax=Actinoplanes subglobosus TaxID=1547892 RepID=A0ABV8ISJ2_9ACTN